MDLKKRCVEVYRDPQPEAGRYGNLTLPEQGDLKPERLPMVSIEVVRLF